MFAKFVLTFALALFLAACSQSEEPKTSNIVIEQPVIRATAPGAPVSGGYVTIRNTGEGSDRLISAAVDFAGKVQIHTMSMVDDVMQMRPVDGGVEIEPGGEVKLARGGMHLMFMELSNSLTEGEVHKVRLVFEKAGEIEVDFRVGDLLGN